MHTETKKSFPSNAGWWIGVPIRRMPPMKRQKPVIWETMLGTVAAARLSPDGKAVVRHFDYDYRAAFEWAGLAYRYANQQNANWCDLYNWEAQPRLSRCRSNWYYPDGPGPGKLAIFRYPPSEPIGEQAAAERPDRDCDADCPRRLHPAAECTCSRSWS